MSLVGVVSEPGSKIYRAAAADALITAGLLILCVICAFAYDIAVWPGGLIAAFLLGSVPLALVSLLDVKSWRRITGGRGPAPLQQPAVEATGLAAAGLPLLLFGALVTVIEVGVGGDKSSDFASWTSTTVGYLLLAALGTQTVLLVLTWLMGRKGSD